MLLALPLIHMPVHPDNAVVEEYSTTLSVFTDPWRRKTAAMAIMLDAIVTQVVDALTDVRDLCIIDASLSLCIHVQLFTFVSLCFS